MREFSIRAGASCAALILWACSEEAEPTQVGADKEMPAVAESGGAGAATIANATGGAAATGGLPGQGGAAATGGLPGQGGATITAGVPGQSQGGAATTGGVPGAAGAAGEAAAGGETTTGGGGTGPEMSGGSAGQGGAGTMASVWSIDALETINGHATTVLGDPEVVMDNGFKAVMFDGDGDRLLVENNPLAGATEFTLEVVFKPNDVFPLNDEPRLLHIEDELNKQRRITLEIRLDKDQNWSLDAFIYAETTMLALLDRNQTHPVGVWSHMAATYKDKTFTSYVNGKVQLSDEIEFLPIAATAKTSLGSRINEVYWFNGAIAFVAATPKALSPEEFVILDKVQ